jgi:hypothetical protein
MTRSDLLEKRQKLKSQIDAIDVVLSLFSGDSNSYEHGDTQHHQTPTVKTNKEEQKKRAARGTINEAILEFGTKMGGPFKATDLVGSGIGVMATIQGALSRLKEHGRIVVVEQGAGRRPTVYQVAGM